MIYTLISDPHPHAAKEDENPQGLCQSDPGENSFSTPHMVISLTLSMCERTSQAPERENARCHLRALAHPSNVPSPTVAISDASEEEDQKNLPEYTGGQKSLPDPCR